MDNHFILLGQNTTSFNEKPTSYSDDSIHKEDEEIINDIKKKENEDKKKEKIKPGRKRKKKNDNENEHNKFSEDNMRRKIKSLLLKYLFIFINNKIKDIYNGNIGNGILKMQLKTLKQSQVFDATINFNKQLLNKTLKEIFSEKITGKFTNFPIDHNKLLIQKLIKEEDKIKQIYFEKLFNLTFIDSLKHFRGDENFSELEGLELFDNINEIQTVYLNKYEDGKDYIDRLRNYLKNYETIINSKKARKKEKNNNNEQVQIIKSLI